MSDLLTIGSGVSGLTRGIERGLSLHNSIQGALDAKEVRNARKEGLKAAKSGYESDLKDKKAGIVTSAAGEEGVNFTGEKVVQDGKTYYKGANGEMWGEDVVKGLASEQGVKDIDAEAVKGVDSVEDRFFANAVPKITDIYMKQGNMDKAQAWQDYSQKRETKKAFGEWQGAYKAFNMGDHEAVAEYVAKQYANYNDGYDLENYEAIKGDDDTVTGFNITLKGPDGKTTTQTIDRDSMMQYGQMALGRGNPQAAFELEYQNNAASQRDRAKTEAQRIRDADQHNRAVGLERIRQNHAVEMEKLRARLGTDTRKRMSDEDIRANALEELNKMDAFGQMSKEERQQTLDDMVTWIKEGKHGSTSPQSAGLK